MRVTKAIYTLCLLKHGYFGWPTKEGFENCKSCFVNGTIRVNFFLKKKVEKIGRNCLAAVFLSIRSSTQQRTVIFINMFFFVAI